MNTLMTTKTTNLDAAAAMMDSVPALGEDAKRLALERGLDVPPKDQLGKTDDEFVKSVQKMVT